MVSELQSKKVLDRRVVEAGKILFRQGDEATCAYLIQQGTVSVYRSVEGRETLVGVVGAGEIVGEMSLLSGNRHTTTARVSENAALVTIEKESLDARYKKSDPLMQKIIEGLIRRLYAKNDEVCGK